MNETDYDALVNLGTCIKGQADRLGIEHEGVPLEGVVVRIAEAALSRAAAPEPEWEYGTAHADDPEAVDMGYTLEGAQSRVAQWNAADPERKGIVVRAPRRVWEPLSTGGNDER
ncbi:hypothetical protein MUN78_16460 [Leucobacter allii]|uniref:Uncharacterized protein n=1 Tax=Leucobacter allii TaxID=2932247 RepID=A0ABY4FLT6_9MICO|nr:hypothetical protein [Leucobacter allii]UOQ57223.1 hypothetical protein MUN78_16460 [Leucobacter allii]